MSDESNLLSKCIGLKKFLEFPEFSMQLPKWLYFLLSIVLNWIVPPPMLFLIIWDKGFFFFSIFRILKSDSLSFLSTYPRAGIKLILTTGSIIFTQETVQSSCRPPLQMSGNLLLWTWHLLCVQMFWYFRISNAVEGAGMWVLILLMAMRPGKPGHFLVSVLLTGELRTWAVV